MVVHLFLTCVLSNSVPTLLPSPNAFLLSLKSSILSLPYHLKIFSPPMTVIRLLLYFLPYLSISPIFHFGIILILWQLMQIFLTTLLQDHSLKPKLQRFLYGIC